MLEFLLILPLQKNYCTDIKAKFIVGKMYERWTTSTKMILEINQ